MNCAFKAVKRVRASAHNNVKGLMSIGQNRKILVPTAGAHSRRSGSTQLRAAAAMGAESASAIFGENLRPLEARICGRRLILLGWWVLARKQERSYCACFCSRSC